MKKISKYNIEQKMRKIKSERKKLTKKESTIYGILLTVIFGWLFYKIIK